MDNTGLERTNNARDDEVSWVEQLTGMPENFNRSYRQLNLGSTTADPDSGAIGRTFMGGSMRIPRQP
ncbi:cysteine protease avirulence protein AvrRpt2, partial [Rhizobium johnstonii]